MVEWRGFDNEQLAGLGEAWALFLVVPIFSSQVVSVVPGTTFWLNYCAACEYFDGKKLHGMLAAGKMLEQRRGVCFALVALARPRRAEGKATKQP